MLIMVSICHIPAARFEKKYKRKKKDIICIEDGEESLLNNNEMRTSLEI